MKHQLCTCSSRMCVNTSAIYYPLWCLQNLFKSYFHSYLCWTAARASLVLKSRNIYVVFNNYISNYTFTKPHCWVTYKAVQLCDTRTHLLLSAHVSFHSVLNECGLVLRCTVMNPECDCQQHWLATRWIKRYASTSRGLQQTQWVGFSSEKRC